MRPGYNLEFFPYAGVRTSEQEGETDTKAAAGLDVKWGIKPNLYLDVTASPDFSEVESDPFIPQLSPYENYLSENRPFFTEGSRYFSLSSGDEYHDGGLSLFYSRRIPNPKFAAKISGKTGGFGFGILGALNKVNVAEEDPAATPITAFSGSRRTSSRTPRSAFITRGSGTRRPPAGRSTTRTSPSTSNSTSATSTISAEWARAPSTRGRAMPATASTSSGSSGSPTPACRSCPASSASRTTSTSGRASSTGSTSNPTISWPVTPGDTTRACSSASASTSEERSARTPTAIPRARTPRSSSGPSFSTAWRSMAASNSAGASTRSATRTTRSCGRRTTSTPTVSASTPTGRGAVF
ncbi:MAG: DUF5916 domain-containing protein [Ignavibacteriales bacterium]|nr:DUF5916 domain-containing protein [Ignavibacteriales bacterium]